MNDDTSAIRNPLPSGMGRLKRLFAVLMVVAVLALAFPLASPHATYGVGDCELVDEVPLGTTPEEMAVGAGFEWSRAFTYEANVTANAIDLFLRRAYGPVYAEGTVIVEWYAADGVLPTGSPLATGSVDVLVAVDTIYSWVRIEFDNLAMQSGATYCLVVTADITTEGEWPGMIFWVMNLGVETNAMWLQVYEGGWMEPPGVSMDGTFRLWNCGGEVPEECHYPGGRVCVTGLMPETLMPTLRGHLSSEFERPVFSYGFVWDSVSRPNPDGYPDTYVDTPPQESGYAHYTQTTVNGHYDNWTFQSTVDWSAGTTYYWRPFVDVGRIGDYIYGPEYVFTMPDCAVVDEVSGPDPVPVPMIYEFMQVFRYETNVTANAIELWMVGDNITAAWYLADVERLPTGESLRTMVVSSGDWVRCDYDTMVFASGTDYCLVVSGDGEWMGVAGDRAAYYQDGEWEWVEGTLTYRLLYCPVPGQEACYKVWGHTPSTFPLWYQAWPSFLKLAYIGIVLVTAVLVYRREDKPKYPELSQPLSAKADSLSLPLPPRGKARRSAC